AAGGGAASVGAALSRNLIGWEDEAEHTATTESPDAFVRQGDRVRLAYSYDQGGTPGRIYEYKGESEVLSLKDRDYSDTSLWKEVKAEPARIQAYIQDSSVEADGALTLTARATGTITAGTGAGSMAVTGGAVGI